MTITISRQAHFELFQETVERSQHPDPHDAMDVIYQYPQPLGQGCWREIALRQGLVLRILNLQLSDRIIEQLPERAHGLEWHFHFAGEHQDKLAAIGKGQYAFYGSGLAPKETIDYLDRQINLEVAFEMEPELLLSFSSNP